MKTYCTTRWVGLSRSDLTHRSSIERVVAELCCSITQFSRVRSDMRLIAVLLFAITTLLSESSPALRVPPVSLESHFSRRNSLDHSITSTHMGTETVDDREPSKHIKAKSMGELSPYVL